MQAAGLMMIEALVLKKCDSFARFFNNIFPGHHNMAVDNAEHVQFTDHLPSKYRDFVQLFSTTMLDSGTFPWISLRFPGIFVE